MELKKEEFNAIYKRVRASVNNFLNHELYDALLDDKHLSYLLRIIKQVIINEKEKIQKTKEV